MTYTVNQIRVLKYHSELIFGSLFKGRNIVEEYADLMAKVMRKAGLRKVDWSTFPDPPLMSGFDVDRILEDTIRYQELSEQRERQ